MHGVGRVGFRMSEFTQNSKFVQFSMADFGRNSKSFVYKAQFHKKKRNKAKKVKCEYFSQNLLSIQLKTLAVWFGF